MGRLVWMVMINFNHKKLDLTVGLDSGRQQDLYSTSIRRLLMIRLTKALKMAKLCDKAGKAFKNAKPGLKLPIEFKLG